MSKVVSQDPEALGGEPVFVGTRVPVRSLFDHLEAGDSIEEFLRGFPTVKREQVVAILKEAKAHAARPQHSRGTKRAKFPLFASCSPGALDVSGSDLARLEAEEDALIHGRTD